MRLLVERSGELVSKQEFFDTVWTDTFVEDNSLTVAITNLRKILGDSARNATFIENLPRKGYRFLGEVVAVEDEPVVVQSAPEASVAPASVALGTAERARTFRSRRTLIGVSTAFVLLLLIALGAAYTGFNRPSASKGQIDSIAVLPFQNQDPDSEYLSDGLTESVINDLAQLPDLRVISRNSVFLYKGKETDASVVGRELNVKTVLTGWFARDVENLIVTAELTDLRSNRQIWKRQYKQTVGELFSLQLAIARDISESLRPNPGEEDGRQAAKRGTESSEAFMLYLKGRHQWNKRVGDSFEKALAYFKDAIEIDPTYAQAYVGLANCYLSMPFSYPVTQEERVAMVKAAAARALEIDPSLGEVRATLAINSHFNEWDWANAEKEYKRAIELSPNYATAHHWYAEFLATNGRFDESFAAYERAMELDPLSLAISTDLGLNYYYSRQPDKAIQHFIKLKESDPSYLRTATFLAMVYEDEGMFDEAISQHETQAAIEGTDMPKRAARMTRLRRALITSGEKGYWAEVLRTATEEDRNSWYAAKAHIRLGHRDKAFELIEPLVTGRSALLVWLKVSPEFDGIRDDPRFPELVRRVGIP